MLAPAASHLLSQFKRPAHQSPFDKPNAIKTFRIKDSLGLVPPHAHFAVSEYVPVPRKLRNLFAKGAQWYMNDPFIRQTHHSEFIRSAHIEKNKITTALHSVFSLHGRNAMSQAVELLARRCAVAAMGSMGGA